LCTALLTLHQDCCISTKCKKSSNFPQYNIFKRMYILKQTFKNYQLFLVISFQFDFNINLSDIKMNGSGDGNDGLPVPKIVLYPEENVRLDWKQIKRIGAGLVNMGNTCFLNSTLQCLTYTAPLVNYCFSDEHNSTC